jgi:glycosyltransferase involved in cell wall biosynthesis
MDSPKISVIIPSYNKRSYIGETLKSIFNQRYSNLEVIIQDGGSTDGTLDIIKKFAKRYTKHINWESKKDKGQLDAINRGMEKATGTILTYINADDTYTPGAFREIVRLYSSNPDAYWFAGRGKVVNASGKELVKAVTWYKNILLFLNTRFYLLVTNYLMQPSVFLTRQAWKKFGPFTGTPDFVTEYDLWLKIAKQEMPVNTAKTLSCFRIEESTITKTNAGKILTEDERIVRKHTGSLIILTLHRLHNWGRTIIGRIV